MSKTREKEYKSFPSFVTKVYEDQGVVDHIVAVMGNIDLGKDVIHPGSFTKTIVERKSKIRVLDQHNSHSTLSVIGKPIELRELSKAELPKELLQEYPEANGALFAKTQFLLDTPEGLGVFNRIKSGALSEWSIGYDSLDTDMSRVKDAEGNDVTVRNLRSIRLYEYSPVIWGMNPATTTLGSKQDKEEDKKVSGKTNLSLASRDREWDSSAAEKRIRTWADAEEAPNSKYRQAFFYYDEDNAENFTAYKLPYADVIDGELKAIPRAIFAVAGGRGVDAADIPSADKEAIKSKVNSYYAKMRKEFDDDTLVSPFEKKKAINLSEQVEDIRQAFLSQYNAPNSWDYWVNAVYDEYVIVTYESENGVQYFRVDYTIENDKPSFAPKGDWVEGEYEFRENGKNTNIQNQTKEDKGQHTKYLGNMLKATLYEVSSKFLSYWFKCDIINYEEMNSLVTQTLNSINSLNIPEDISMREVSYEYLNEAYMSTDNLEEIKKDLEEVKAGRVLSQANVNKLKRIMEMMQEMIAIGMPMMEDEEDDKEAPVEQAAKNTQAGPQNAPTELRYWIEEEELKLIET